jgi:Zn-dependent oligopeptidase
VTLNKQETLPGELWHPSVVKLSVDHPQQGTVAYIYCDLFERSVGQWCDDQTSSVSIVAFLEREKYLTIVISRFNAVDVGPMERFNCPWSYFM